MESWNRNHFGKIHKEKKKLLARLEGIDERLSLGSNRLLVDLQRILWEDYEKVLVQGELIWFQTNGRVMEIRTRNTSMPQL